MGCEPFLNSAPVIHGCFRACSGVVLFSGSHMKHLSKKSRKASSEHFNASFKLIVPIFFNFLIFEK
jgi:hypothetical protein